MLCSDILITRVAQEWRVELHFSSGDFIGIGFGKTLIEAIRHAINDALKKGVSYVEQ